MKGSGESGHLATGGKATLVPVVRKNRSACVVGKLRLRSERNVWRRRSEVASTRSGAEEKIRHETRHPKRSDGCYELQPGESGLPFVVLCYGERDVDEISQDDPPFPEVLASSCGESHRGIDRGISVPLVGLVETTQRRK